MRTSAITAGREIVYEGRKLLCSGAQSKKLPGKKYFSQRSIMTKLSVLQVQGSSPGHPASTTGVTPGRDSFAPARSRSGSASASPDGIKWGGMRQRDEVGCGGEPAPRKPGAAGSPGERSRSEAQGERAKPHAEPLPAAWESHQPSPRYQEKDRTYRGSYHGVRCSSDNSSRHKQRSDATEPLPLRFRSRLPASLPSLALRTAP